MTTQWPRIKRDYGGLRVRTTRPMRNVWCEVPAGTVCTVNRWSKGLDLTSDPCPCCGVRVQISQVQLSSVEILSDGERGAE